ncbi:tudor and KH domain-containing protein homolog [Nilaparvata lugens]|uniref:tudor and KH domain-containing protein homolog n=1 Tax=Nilaparvata lugens TaxID=108931 RepID=UPI00193D4181|nr:tudor and KH domain-containing protein homolog [Nilaparvata lugens]
MGFKSWGLLLAVPMMILSATAIYYLYKQDENEYDEYVRTTRCTTREVKIPKDTIGVVIGRAGSNIKEIESKSNTRIRFNDDVADDEFRTCVIRGSKESVILAELLIHDFITSQPLIETYEMWVPKNAMGRIIGRGGENIKAITRDSCCKVSADSNRAPGTEENRIILKGTAEQIAVAKSLIEEKVEEEIEMRKTFDERSSNRYPRNKPAKAISNIPANDDMAGAAEKHSTEKLVSVVSDGSMQIFVSAVASPKKFWVQVLSPKSVKLDHLVDQMTDYYNTPENKELHTIKQLEVGQIVAAPFAFDERWYRAEVCGVKQDDYEPSASKVSLYYVDYGDEGEQPAANLYQLRTDFLTLHFQAIECSLARVKPREGGEWSREATDLFEELCHVALWRPLTARVVSYDKADKRRGDREGSPVPAVDLYDPEAVPTSLIYNSVRSGDRGGQLTGPPSANPPPREIIIQPPPYISSEMGRAAIQLQPHILPQIKRHVFEQLVKLIHKKVMENF